jgi:hypothetical protein
MLELELRFIDDNLSVDYKIHMYSRETAKTKSSAPLGLNGFSEAYMLHFYIIHKYSSSYVRLSCSDHLFKLLSSLRALCQGRVDISSAMIVNQYYGSR